MNFLNQNVLIIEDDLETLEVMVEIFESMFSFVYTATDGFEAFRIFQDKKIDAVLCDINIPNLNGLELINKIHKISYSIPIIVISACSDTQTLLKASNSCIQGYIIKPITSDKVKNIVERIVYHQNNELMAKIEINNSITLDLENLQVIVDEKVIKLTTKEKELLKLLFEKKGSVVSYKTIEQVVWYDDCKTMSNTSLRTLVKNIRKKLSFNIIENIPKTGYKLVLE